MVPGLRSKLSLPLVAFPLLLLTPSAAIAQVSPDRIEKEFAGIVVDENGNPLADVAVDAWTWYPGNETTTDEKGVFRLTLGEENPELRFSKPGYSPHYIPQQSRDAKAFLVTLNDDTFLEGVLRGPDGRPVANATIRAEQGPHEGDGVVINGVTTTTTTDADGRYRLYLFPEEYQIQVAVPDTGVARIENIAVAAGQGKQFDVKLSEGVCFVANVIDATSGKPVKDVVLWNWRDRSVLGISDGEGKIVIDGMLPGKYEFNVGHGEPEKIRELGGAEVYQHGELGRWWSADAAKEWQRRTVEPSGWQRNFDDLSFELAIGMEPVTIEVEQGVVFTGHVYDPEGKPVAGATVAPAKTGSGNSLTGDTRYSVRTKADGSYRVVMPAGNGFKYNLIAHDGDNGEWRQWANGVSEPLETKPGQTVSDFDLTLTRPATVRGKVTGDAGQSLREREVRAAASDGRENRYYDPTVRVQDDGTFELKFIRPGKHHIQVSPFWLSAKDAPAGTSAEVELAEGEVRDGIELKAPDQQ